MIYYPFLSCSFIDVRSLILTRYVIHKILPENANFTLYKHLTCIEINCCRTRDKKLQ